MILFCDRIVQAELDRWVIDAHDELGREFKNIPVWRAPFIRDLKKNEYAPRGLVHFDYAYAITCHKSQGSEWDSVMVYDEWMPPQVWDMKRWRYTAITRASKQLTIYV